MVDINAFRDGMAMLASAVTVVTTGASRWAASHSVLTRASGRA